MRNDRRAIDVGSVGIGTCLNGIVHGANANKPVDILIDNDHRADLSWLAGGRLITVLFSIYCVGGTG